MLLPIFFFQCADDDTLTGTRMYEFPVFQVDAYMGGTFLLSSVVEENQIAFTEFSFLDFSAILLPLVIGVSFEFFLINFAIDSGGQSRTIHPSSGGSTSSIRYSQPTGRFYILGMVVLHLDIYS